MPPRAGLVLTPGHFMNNLGGGPQGDATYQISMPSSFREEKKFEDGLLCSYVPNCDPRGRASFDPWGII